MINKLKWIAAVAAVTMTLSASAQRKSASRNSKENSRSEKQAERESDQRNGNRSEHITSFQYDSVDTHTEKMVMYKDGDVYKMKMTDGKLAQLSINGKEIEQQNFAQYESLVQKLKKQMKEDQEQAERDREQAEVDREQAEVDRQQAEEDVRQAREEMEQDRREAEQDSREAEQEARQAKEEMERDRRQAEEDTRQAQQDREQAKQDEEQAKRDMIQAEKDRKQAEEDRKTMASITEDLIKEKVIAKSGDLFALELTNKGLIVNDEKQPDELFRKMKEKYLKRSNDGIHFSNRGNRSRIQAD